jgi:hypothetical protein
MKVVKLLTVFTLLLGGMTIAAINCAEWSIPGMIAGIAIAGLGVLLSNLWESEVCD